MAVQNPRNPLAPPDLTQQPINGLQATPAGQTDPNAAPMQPSPFATPQAFAQAQFTGAGSEPHVQSDLALARDQQARRNATMGSNASFDADLQRRIDEFYAEAERGLNPMWETRAREFEQSLVGRGIDPNSEAGQRARADFDRSRTDAFNSARNQATQFGAGLQNQRWQQQFAQDQADAQSRLANAQMGANQANLSYNRDWAERQFNEDRRRYDQGYQFERDRFGEDTRRYDQGFDFNTGRADMSDLMTLLGFDRDSVGMNNQIGMQELQSILPFLGMIPQGGPTGIDVMSPYQLQMQGQQANAQNAASQNNGLFGALGQIGQGFMGPSRPWIFSDERVKEGIKRIGTADNGLPIYLFRYRGALDDGRVHMGLMAQDVEKVNPEAVVEVGGVKMVNYDLAVA